VRDPRVRSGVVSGALLLALGALSARGQTTGSISGWVADSSGARLPGVTVEVESSSLQGIRSATTSSDGKFWFPVLPPGEYHVRAKAASFRPGQKSAVVSLDATATVSFELEPAVEESVAVSSAAPRIDVTSTTSGTTYSSDVIAKLPVGRNYAEIVKANPAVATDRGETQGRSLALAIYGATSAENLWIIDGVNTTSVLKGLQGKAINNEFIDEVEVKTGGYMAEYGGALGGVVNVVTKSGGNAFHGDGFVYFDSDATTAKQVFTQQDETAAEMRFVDQARADSGFDLGGYVLKDRLWFFAAYDRVRFTSEVSRVSVPPGSLVSTTDRFPIDTTDDLYSGKLTWNVSPATSLVATVFADPSDGSGAMGVDPRQGTPSDRFESTAILSTDSNTWFSSREQGGTDFGLRATQLFGSEWLAAVQASHHRDKNAVTAAQGIRIVDETCDAQPPGTPSQPCTPPDPPNSVSGGYGGIDGSLDHNISNRQQIRADATWARGAHELRAGGSYEHGDGRSTYSYTGLQEVTKFDEYGQPYYRHSFGVASLDDLVPIASASFRVSVRSFASYFQDSWKPAAGLTVNAGLRYDAEDIRDYQGVSRLDLTKEWQPRLGIVWDPGRDGRTKISAFAGRFYYALPTFGTSNAFNGVVGVFTYNFSPTSVLPDPNVIKHPDSGDADVWHPPGSTQVDSNLRGMHQDEVTLAVERLLAPALTVGIKGTYRKLGNAIEDRCDLDYTAPENEGNTCAIVNPGSAGQYARGDFIACDGLGNCGVAGQPSPPARRYYRGIELLARESVGDRLWLQASYVYSSLRGNYDGGVNQNFQETSPGTTSDFDYPLLWYNASGRLFLDRPNRFRFDGYWTTPWRLSVGLQAFAASGPPLDRIGYFNFNSGYGVYLVPRGSVGRLPTQWDANLTLAYPLTVGPATVTLQTYLFNLFNNQVPTSRDDFWTKPGLQPPDGYPDVDSILDPNQQQKNPNYGKYTTRMDPRMFRAAVKVSF